MAGCKTDQDCNGIPQVSSLQGRCYRGICICNDGLHVQPDGKCSKVPPPSCMPSGGKCFQNPATCPSGLLEGSSDVSMCCGDIGPAVGCFDATTCIGPKFTCCGPADEPRALVIGLGVERARRDA